jgi:hypothetical protein
MLRDALYDVGAFPEKICIPFFGAVLDPGEKKIHIMGYTLVKDLYQHLFLSGQLFHQLIEVLFGQHQQVAGLECFYAELAGLTGPEAFHGGDAFPFEEELEADVLAMVVEPHADAAFANEICLAGYLPFLQQNGFRRDGDLPEKVLVFFPVDGRRGCLIFMR